MRDGMKPEHRIEQCGQSRDCSLRPKPRDVRLVIPWPPSVNTLYRTYQGRVIYSKEGRIYKLDVATAVLQAGLRSHFGRHRLRVEIRACQTDRRKRDLDNLAKASLDALTKAGLWEDDSTIDELTIKRSIVCAGTGSRLEILASAIVE